MSTKRKHISYFRMGLCLLLISSCVWAANTVDVSNSQWDLSGTARLAVVKAGSVSAKTTVHFEFGPNAASGLAVNQWKFTDAEDDHFDGTYELDNRGKPLLDPNDVALENYLKNGLTELLQDEYANIEISNVGLTKASITASAVSNKKGTTLTLRMNVKAVVDCTVDGQSGQFKMTLTFNGKETHPYEPAAEQTQGSAWLISAQSSFKAVGLPKITDESFYTLILGPNTDWQLTDDEFLVIVDDEGEEILLYGTYVRNKNKITFKGLEDVFEQSIIDYAEAALDMADDIYWYSDVGVSEVTKYSVTATIKEGKWIKTSVNIRCIGEAYVDGEYGTARCTFTEKGVGTPTDPGLPAE